MAVAALTVYRALHLAGVAVDRFDTSAHAQREDIYRARGFGSVARNIGLLARMGRWVHEPGGREAVYHIFVTSDRAFARDQAFMWILKLARRRLIVHLHSKPTGEYWVAPQRLRRFGRMLALGDRVVVLSETHRRFFAQYVPSEKLGVLENFVISTDFESKFDTRPHDILYLSRISEMKGAWDLVRALEQLRQARPELPFRVTIAGTADTTRTQQELEAFIRGAGLEDRITFSGHVEGAAKTALFRDHGVFVFPSRFENSPITLKEATQAGMAIVASDIEANRNILSRSGNALFYACADAAAMANALAALMDDEATYRRLREAAQVSSRFDENYALPVIRRLVESIQR